MKQISCRWSGLVAWPRLTTRIRTGEAWVCTHPPAHPCALAGAVECGLAAADAHLYFLSSPLVDKRRPFVEARGPARAVKSPILFLQTSPDQAFMNA